MDTLSLHLQAEHLRETERCTEALSLYATVIAEYEAAHDYAGMVEARGGTILTHKHLFLTTGKKAHLDEAGRIADEALAIARQHGLTEKLFRCYFHIGEIAIIRDAFTTAIAAYTQSLDFFPSEENAEKGDILYHLGVAQYRHGEHDLGISTILAGIALIEKYESTTDSFVWHVWRSGGYLSLATLLVSENRSEAERYLDIAESIIFGDPRLVIRHRQLQELKSAVFLHAAR